MTMAAKGLRSRVFFPVTQRHVEFFSRSRRRNRVLALLLRHKILWPRSRARGINISRGTLPSRWTLLYDCTDVPRETLNGGSPRRRPEEYTSHWMHCVLLWKRVNARVSSRSWSTAYTLQLVYVARRNLETNQPEQKQKSPMSLFTVETCRDGWSTDEITFHISLQRLNDGCESPRGWKNIYIWYT